MPSGNLSNVIRAVRDPPDLSDPAKDIRALQRAINVEVYFLTTCPHCLDIIRLSVTPLIEAKLPGDKVQLTLLPVLKGMSNPVSCRATHACQLALAPLCALKATLPQPAPADSPELRRGAQFVACDIAATAGDLGRKPDARKDCAEEAGFPWNGAGGLQKCAQGHEAFDIMYSAAYADNVIAAMHRLKNARFKEPPRMPWIFLNGDLLTCMAENCIAIHTSDGDRPLKRPGSLLYLVCTQLQGAQPDACKNVTSTDARNSSNKTDVVNQTEACENCMEVGTYHWQSVSKGFAVPMQVLVVIGGIITFAGILGQIVWQCAHRKPEEGLFNGFKPSFCSAQFAAE